MQRPRPTALSGRLAEVGGDVASEPWGEAEGQREHNGLSEVSGEHGCERAAERHKFEFRAAKPSRRSSTVPHERKRGPGLYPSHLRIIKVVAWAPQLRPAVDFSPVRSVFARCGPGCASTLSGIPGCLIGVY